MENEVRNVECLVKEQAKRKVRGRDRGRRSGHKLTLLVPQETGDTEKVLVVNGPTLKAAKRSLFAVLSSIQINPTGIRIAKKVGGTFLITRTEKEKLEAKAQRLMHPAPATVQR